MCWLRCMYWRKQTRLKEDMRVDEEWLSKRREGVLEELYRGSKECQVAKEGRIEGIKTRSHKLKVVDRMR